MLTFFKSNFQEYKEQKNRKQYVNVNASPENCYTHFYWIIINKQIIWSYEGALCIVLFQENEIL